MTRDEEQRAYRERLEKIAAGEDVGRATVALLVEIAVQLEEAVYALYRVESQVI